MLRKQVASQASQTSEDFRELGELLLKGQLREDKKNEQSTIVNQLSFKTCSKQKNRIKEFQK